MPTVNFGIGDFVQGGLIQDVDAKVSNGRFEHFDYHGKAPRVVAYAADLTGPDDETVTQHWSVGSSGRDGAESPIWPSEDGMTIESNIEGFHLKRGSKFFALLESVAAAGGDITKANRADFLDGMTAHVIRQKVKTGGGQEGDALVVAPKGIKVFPGGKAGSSNGSKSGPASTPAVTTPATSDPEKVQEGAVATLVEIAKTLPANQPVSITKLKMEATKVLIKSTNPYKNIRKEIAAKLEDHAWLEANGPDAGLLFENGNLTKPE